LLFCNVEVEIVDFFAFFDSVYGIFDSFVLVFSFNYQLILYKPPNAEFSLNQSYPLHYYGTLVRIWVGLASYFKVTTRLQSTNNYLLVPIVLMKAIDVASSFLSEPVLKSGKRVVLIL